MEQNYLLTFYIYIKELDKSIPSYAWFENEMLMDVFIKSTKNITVTEKMEINSCKYL